MTLREFLSLRPSAVAVCDVAGDPVSVTVSAHSLPSLLDADGVPSPFGDYLHIRRTDHLEPRPTDPEGRVILSATVCTDPRSAHEFQSLPQWGPR